MEFWLTYNNREEEIQLPVPPPTFTITKGNLNKTVNTAHKTGEVNLLSKGEGQLAEITIESFFPAQDYYFCQYHDFPKPYECIEMIERWRKTGQPMRLIITDTDVNLAAGIESFEYGERDGTGDVYFTLELKEYRFMKVFTPIKKEQEQKVERPVTKPTPKTYTVQKGDSLWAIAKKLTGNGNNWRTLYNKNKAVIGSNPNRIYPGQKLVI